MGNLSDIPDAELFTDLQMSLTDIVLMEMLTNIFSVDNYKERLCKEKNISEVIKAEIKQRFSEKQIMEFLDSGYLRRVNLADTNIKNDRFARDGSA